VFLEDKMRPALKRVPRSGDCCSEEQRSVDGVHW
jgi:hypothetical protein